MKTLEVGAERPNLGGRNPGTSLQHFWELDVLRWIAAFSVLLLHYFIRGFATDDNTSPLKFESIAPYVKYFHLGVQLFFMISGFVILMSTERMGQGLKAARKFLVARPIRLYPAYLSCCALTFAAVKILNPDLVDISWPRFIINMTILNGFLGVWYVEGVYWTLFVELKFYIIAAVLLTIGVWKDSKSLVLFLGVWILLSGINYWNTLPIIGSALILEHAPFFLRVACFIF